MTPEGKFGLVTGVQADADTYTLDMAEFEEAKPCDGRTHCPNEAKWAVWVRHTKAVCPLECFMCDDCKKASTEYWQHLIDYHPTYACARCGPSSEIGKSGKVVEDFIRFMAL